MSFYECVFIARQDVSKSQVDTLCEKYTDILKELSGKVEKNEYWGLRNLAYKINKNKKGHYVLFNINAPADAIAEMERKMRIDENIIRYMTIKVDALDNEPSVMMNPKKFEDERAGEVFEAEEA